MSRITTRLAAATAITLLAPLGLVGASGPASAADDPCPGMSAPANDDVLNQAPTPAADTASVQSGTFVNIRVLANDTDPDGDALYVTSTSKPARGQTCVGAKGLVRYIPNIWKKDRTDTFTYGVTDGDRYRTATVTVEVAGLKPLRPVVRQRLVLGKGGKVKQPARVSFTNTNSKRAWVLLASPRKEEIVGSRNVYPGQTVVFGSREKRLQYISLLAPKTGELVFINEGNINTRNGATSSYYIGESLFRTAEQARGQQLSAAEVWAARPQ